jgi:hypothetical protein
LHNRSKLQVLKNAVDIEIMELATFHPHAPTPSAQSAKSQHHPIDHQDLVSAATNTQ